MCSGVIASSLFVPVELHHNIPPKSPKPTGTRVSSALPPSSRDAPSGYRVATEERWSL